MNLHNLNINCFGVVMKIALLQICVLLFIFNLFACAKELKYEITKSDALNAVKNYNCEVIPGLEEKAKSDDYTIYWDIASEDDNQIVVIFRSYTGSINRYYIDKSTGEAYETVQVPGIIDDEEKTGVTLNIKDYIGK